MRKLLLLTMAFLLLVTQLAVAAEITTVLQRSYTDRKTKLSKSISLKRFRGEGYRLVHDGKKVLAFFYCKKGTTETRADHYLFTGTLDECIALIKQLKLSYDPTMLRAVIQEQKLRVQVTKTMK